MKSKYVVLTLFENEAARKAAEEFCKELAARHWQQYDLELTFVELNELSRPASKRKASALVSSADMAIFAISDRPLSQQQHAWAESALARRGDKEGFLVMLGDCRFGRNELLLRNLAHHAGMDFITEVPPSLAASLPESPEPYTDRAHEVSDLLADILRRPPPVAPRIPVR